MRKYIQCTLIKKDYDSILQQVSYIPEKFAKLNEVISLKKYDDYCWDNDWKVSSVGSYIIDVENDRMIDDMFTRC